MKMSKMKAFNPSPKYLFLLLALVGILSVEAQTVKELENQRKQTLQKIETANKILNETQRSQRSTLNKLTIINRNISERKTLISNINKEVDELEAEMLRLQQESRLLENRLRALKADYARLVQEAHINRSVYAKIMFVLSADSFDQSYRRLRYLQEYSNYRKEQAREIQRVQVEITQKADDIAKHLNTQKEVLKQKEDEAKKLVNDEKREKVLLTDLRKKERSLRDDIRLQQRRANELNNRIERLIAEEIRKAEARKAAEEKKRQEEARKARETAEAKAKAEAAKTGTPAKSTTPDKPTTTPPATKPADIAVSAATKEETLLSGNFAANQGRMPWPVEKGFISGKYGVQPHPVLKHVTTNNKGIYIQTPARSNARAIFDGVVTQRFSVPGSNHAVIIQHGNFRTVYANLTDIYVKEGQKVTAKQAIGRIYTDDESDNKTELYFQIWRDKVIQNPESWITR